jgi:coenzyme F420-reducing hydrogenase alpha subunit
LKELVIPYATAKGAEFNQSDYAVGALARIALNKTQLHPEAKKALKGCSTKLPNHSPFSTNLCQAIELLHCIESAIDSLENFSPRNEPMQEIVPKECTGIGVTEAPRGLLYHSYSLDSKGFVTDSNMIIPTQQNIKSIELDLKELVPTLLSKPKPKAELEMEKLIRAYDPCISCSVHFLKVKWA